MIRAIRSALSRVLARASEVSAPDRVEVEDRDDAAPYVTPATTLSDEARRMRAEGDRVAWSREERAPVGPLKGSLRARLARKGA